MIKTLVFTATYNEKKNIREFINSVFKASDKVDLLIIDDNSPDKTYNEIKKHNQFNKRLYLIIRKKKLGLDTAHKLGYEYARKNNYNKFITLDADLSHDPFEIPKFIKYLNYYDFVIGSRYILGAKNNQPLSRYIISYFGNKLIKFLLKSSLNEHTTSYRGFNLVKLNNFNLKLVKASGYSFFMGTIHALRQRNIRMIEIPIIFNDRVHGTSKIPKIEILRTMLNLLVFSFKK